MTMGLSTLNLTAVKDYHEEWDCYDKRLPLTKDLVGTPPDADMLNTIQYIQLEEIMVVKKGKEHIFVFGNRRLRAIRQNIDQGKGSGKVKVCILTGIDPDNIDLLRLIENEQRSCNEIGAYQILHKLINTRAKTGGNLGTIYKEVAEITGYPYGRVKAIDDKWKEVPLWAVNAVEDGKIAATVAIALGKMKPDTQTLLKNTYKETGKLTANDVKAQRQVVRQSAYANMSVGLGANLTAPRQIYGRGELQQLVDLIPASAKEAKQFGAELLAQVQ